MHQLTQQLKSGKMEIIEAPFPVLNKGYLLVQNHYSVISAGTEGKTVSDARKGYIAKAKSRQKEVKQVIELVKNQGLKETYKMIMNKLEAPSPLGYSTAGEVIAVGEGVSEFKAGDYVSCGGATASHAEIIAVPVNLCVKLPNNTYIEQAAFATIASVAIQGIRQADCRIGENCVIIGMGLIGQVTALILQAGGIRAIGVDIDKNQLELAQKAGVNHVINRNSADIEQQIKQRTNGKGADSVIITAATSSTDPVEFSGVIARRKARIVIVGAVPTGFSRTNYYKKELELLMSCSYGPGRYDTGYEDKGIDYPYEYVRFTENRNMATFVNLLYSKKIDIAPLISHKFELVDAPDAYQMIVDKSEPFSGILIKYNHEEKKQNVRFKNKTYPPSGVKASLIGAGAFAQNILLPKLAGLSTFNGICTGKGNTAVHVGKKYNFEYATNDAEKLINDKNCNTVFVLTRHNLHAKYVLLALKAGKHVFVEKPLALTMQELDEIHKHHTANAKSMLMVGFNRRFSPAVQKIKTLFGKESAKSIKMRINAGVLPTNHWVNDPEIGGGRIIGEACHFIDLSCYIAGANANSVYATRLSEPGNQNNTVNISLEFANGSIASISYFSNGSKKLDKEYIEVFCGGTVAVIHDFKMLTIHGTKTTKIKYKEQDKGHKHELQEFTKAINNGKQCPIPYTDIYSATKITFDVLQSIRENRVIKY